MSALPRNKPILVTCGLPYANGKAHIGHLRTYVPADVYVRSLKKDEKETVFVCGSDTHGTPIVVNAEEQHISPKQLVEQYHQHFDAVFKSIGVIFDSFGTTDDPENHHRTTNIVTKLINNGYVYPKVIEIAYCPACDRFLPDRYVSGVCPFCSKNARGDECDQGCGKHLEPGELQEPTCTICKGPAEYKEQEHFFFKLSEFKEYLLEHLEGMQGTPNARNYAMGWVKQELNDWCITRTLEWGVKFPWHEDLVVYVWVDAPIGYIAFTEQWAKAHDESWKQFWKEDCPIVHFIGGDIIYHHCIFWPAMLKGAGYSQPWAVVSSGMVKIEDKKFSKSRGYVVWVEEDYLEQGFHPDLLRYYLVSYTSHTKEVNFSWKVFQERINSELVAVLGNFLYRSLLFIFKNFGEIPAGEISPKVKNKIKETINGVTEAIEEYEFKKAVDTAMSLASFGNSYFQSYEPWKLIKENKAECGYILYNCVQIAKALIILFEPVMPEKMELAWQQIRMDSDIHKTLYKEATFPVVAGTKLTVPSILFEKLEDKKIDQMTSILDARVRKAISKEAGIEEDEFVPIKDEIEYDDFAKVDIRVGKILSAEKIKKSKKLLRLIVDAGEPEPRQIVAGLADFYDAEELVGKMVNILVNLKPARLCGVESQGMLLAADAGENVCLLTQDKDIKPGSIIR